MATVSVAYRTFNFIISHNLKLLCVIILPRDGFPRWEDANGVFLLEQHPKAAVDSSNRQRNGREPCKFLREV